jgi:hypothetical protein
MEEAVALVKEGFEANKSYKHGYRIYTPEIGPFEVLVVEWEFESMEEQQRSWAEWAARPDTPAFFEKWFKLFERGGGTEIWKLAAHRA